ncbi:hypothetical protein C7476_10944 [Phyllobacterium bourgognense]|uniref:Uncharacterized protein n=1 Tax=Phyllobacterium bourgognense TaxID=314236 RepID=A0A368YNQ8_9HYPH|nr:hypothetical protein C7476_10944 [Phyllobacterium bourgognense]
MVRFGVADETFRMLCWMRLEYYADVHGHLSPIAGATML